jgi:transcriptional regulator of acetoin/glycerol metabolism
LLVHAFLKRYGQERVTRIDDEALGVLEAYAWPGNVRELQNIVERACALADADTVRRRDLPDYVLEARALPAAAPATTLGAGRTLQEAREHWMQSLESAYLRDLLDRHGGNISSAAKAAGIDRKTFHRLASKYGIR